MIRLIQFASPYLPEASVRMDPTITRARIAPPISHMKTSAHDSRLRRRCSIGTSPLRMISPGKTNSR